MNKVQVIAKKKNSEKNPPKTKNPKNFKKKPNKQTNSKVMYECG